MWCSKKYKFITKTDILGDKKDAMQCLWSQFQRIFFFDQDNLQLTGVSFGCCMDDAFFLSEALYTVEGQISQTLETEEVDCWGDLLSPLG